MDLLKKSLLILLVAIILDITITSAVTYTTRVVAVNIAPGGKVTTSDREKTTYATQTYENTYTNTTLTSPCLNCPIGIRFENKAGTLFTDRTVYMNQTVTCNNSALNQPGKYHITLRRTDITALTTYTSGNWNY